MDTSQDYRLKADELLRAATLTDDLRERSRLITEASHWHMKVVAANSPKSPEPDGETSSEDQPTG